MWMECIVLVQWRERQVESMDIHRTFKFVRTSKNILSKSMHIFLPGRPVILCLGWSWIDLNDVECVLLATPNIPGNPFNL